MLLEGFMQISLKKKFSSTMSFSELRSLSSFHADSNSSTTKDNSNHSRDKNFVVEMLEEDD